MLTKKEIQHIAKLARLEFTEKELVKFTQELSSILDYMEILKEVNTEKIEPVAQVTGLKNITRTDEVQKWQAPEKLLECSGQTKERGMLKVPRVI